jgi:3-oxoacyl-[acyl-carrier-protein] synthase-1
VTSANPVFLSDLGVISSLGRGKEAVWRGLLQVQRPELAYRDDLLPDGESIHVGAVNEDLPVLPSDLIDYSSRNASLLMSAIDEIRDSLESALSKYGRPRIAVVMGTSTSGIAEGEKAVFHATRSGALPEGFNMLRQELGSPGEIAARYLGLEGPAFTVSTACSSSAQALADGRRLLRSGLADAVLVGGVDSLCWLTVNGFRALSALSKGICNPFSRNRDGTMVGEGAAIFLMEREESEIAIYGAGASCDAYSMTAPDPEAYGVELAIRMALEDSGTAPQEIGFIELHGTGTKQNDAMESKAVLRVFGTQIPCSSSKGRIGHTLGAAGAMGAAHCWLAASTANEAGHLPPHVWDGEAEDGLLNESLVQPGQRLGAHEKRLFLSNAFAFGGNNVSLVIGRWG